MLVVVLLLPHSLAMGNGQLTTVVAVRQHLTHATQQPAGAAREQHNKRTRGQCRGGQHNNQLMFHHAATTICGIVICPTTTALSGIVVCQAATAIHGAVFGCATMAIGSIVFGLIAPLWQ